MARARELLHQALDDIRRGIDDLRDLAAGLGQYVMEVSDDGIGGARPQSETDLLPGLALARDY